LKRLLNLLSRIPKGARAAVMTRLPFPVYDRVRDEAASRGISLSQLIADIVSAGTGVLATGPGCVASRVLN
jgi:hypothetical protein